MWALSPPPTVSLIQYEIWCLFSRSNPLKGVFRSLKWKKKKYKIFLPFLNRPKFLLKPLMSNLFLDFLYLDSRRSRFRFIYERKENCLLQIIVLFSIMTVAVRNVLIFYRQADLLFIKSGTNHRRLSINRTIVDGTQVMKRYQLKLVGFLTIT